MDLSKRASTNSFRSMTDLVPPSCTTGLGCTAHIASAQPCHVQQYIGSDSAPRVHICKAVLWTSIQSLPGSHLWGHHPYTASSRIQGCSLALHHRNTAAKWEPANCKGKTPPGTGSQLVCGGNSYSLSISRNIPPWTRKGLCWCTDAGRAAGHAALREVQHPQLCSLSPIHPPKGKLDPAGEIIAFLSSPFSSHHPWCPALDSRNTPWQTQALFTMPEMLNSNSTAATPRSSMRWEPTFIDKQFLLQDFPDGISPSQRAHTLPLQIMKPKPSKRPRQRRYCLAIKHWGPFWSARKGKLNKWAKMSISDA